MFACALNVQITSFISHLESKTNMVYIKQELVFKIWQCPLVMRHVVDVKHTAQSITAVTLESD